MITDEKILELVGLILDVKDWVFLLSTDQENNYISKTRNWLEENDYEPKTGEVNIISENNITKMTFQRFSEIEHWSEEYECAMMMLDKFDIPKNDIVNNEKYSLVGRIKLYKEI